MPETMGGNLHSLIDLAHLVLWNSVVLHIGKWKLVLYAFGAILKREGSKPLHLTACAKQAGIEVEGPFEPVLPHEPDPRLSCSSPSSKLSVKYVFSPCLCLPSQLLQIIRLRQQHSSGLIRVQVIPW